MYKLVFILTSLGVVVISYILIFLFIHNYIKSTALLLEIFPLIEPRPLSVLEKEPIKKEVEIISGKNILKTDIWIPGDLDDKKKYPAIILSAGVNLPKDDHRILATIKGLAKSGFVVVVSDVPELLASRYLSSTINDFVNIFQFVEEQPYVEKTKVGFAGFCLGSSFALLASSEEEIRDRVSYILVNDVLYDMYKFTRDAVTEKINDNEPVIDWYAEDETREILYREYSDYIIDDKEGYLIFQTLFKRERLTEEQYKNLSNDGKVFYDFLSNTDPNKSPELFARLPEEAKKIIDNMSPKTKIRDVKAKLFVTSGRNVFLPASQAKDLVSDLPKDQVSYTSLEFFQHDKTVKSENAFENIIQAMFAIKHLKNVFDFVQH